MPELYARNSTQLPTKSENHSFGAFVVNPAKIHFATQAGDERVFLVIRRHPITQLSWIFASLLLILLPLVGTTIIANSIKALGLSEIFVLLTILVWYVITFGYILVNFILWYFNVNIVTNNRIIDVDFPSLLIQEVTATRITQVEDVTYKRIGILGSLFDYGDVYVQTAGTEVNIEFLQVPRPRQIVKIIIELMGKQK